MLRAFFAWLFASAGYGARLLRSLLGWIRACLPLRLFRRALVLALLLAGVLAAVRALPVVYGRYALLHAAGDAARQVHLKGEERVLADLRRTAAGLGLIEAAGGDRAFNLETTLEDGGNWCTIRFEFIHVVDLYGFARVPVTLRGQVQRAVLEPEQRIQPSNQEND